MLGSWSTGGHHVVCSPPGHQAQGTGRPWAGGLCPQNLRPRRAVKTGTRTTVAHRRAACLRWQERSARDCRAPAVRSADGLHRALACRLPCRDTLPTARWRSSAPPITSRPAQYPAEEVMRRRDRCTRSRRHRRVGLETDCQLVACVERCERTPRYTITTTGLVNGRRHHNQHGASDRRRLAWRTGADLSAVVTGGR